MQNHSLVPPNSFGPPTMVAVVVDFKDRAMSPNELFWTANNWTLVQFFSTVSFQIRRQLVSIRERIVTLHWLHLYGFSPLCFLCASSNISLNWLSKRMQNHIYCICLIFHHCVLFIASSNYKSTLFAFVWLLPGVYNQRKGI